MEPGSPLASGSSADGSRGAALEEQDEGDREVLRLTPLKQQGHATTTCPAPGANPMFVYA